ncbi:histidine decarboxylase-like [Bacillus rossius redtenbacheri]|uniref:histidine decarboxylase-like n=1 Tax=Bacillus rossius redtenbacheri TaxID=93214 RepID=UPI002FDE5D1F
MLCIYRVKDMSIVEKTLKLEQDYTRNETPGLEVNLMHRQLSLTRYFHALKVWFMMKSTGVEGIRAYVRESARLCRLLVQWVRDDRRFELCAPSHLGMAVFRLRGDNCLTERLLARLNREGNTCCSLAKLRHISAIRFFVASQHTTEDDIRRDWGEVQRVATATLRP